MSKTSRFKKSVALFLAVTLQSPLISWAFTPGHYFQTSSNSNFSKKTQKFFSIPVEFGTVLDTFEGNGNKAIICIQDLHCNYEVQKNIAGIIGYLAKEHGLKLVGTEGAWDKVDTSVIREFPFERIREEVADYFLRQGKLTGADYSSATGVAPLDLEGIEDKGLYESSLRSVLGFLNAGSQGNVAELRDRLNGLKSKFYNSNLQKFDSRCTAFCEGKLEFLEYCAYLAGVGKELGVRMKSYPQLCKYLNLEKSFLVPRAKPESLFSELSRLNQAVRERYYDRPEQQDLDAALRRVDTMERMLNISATREDLAAFDKNRGQYTVKGLADFLRMHTAGTSELDPQLYALDPNLSQCESFYQNADARSRRFVDNLLAKMEKSRQNLAVMVNGGFHTPEVLKLLKARGISYMEIQPRLPRRNVINPYFDLLRGRQSPLEKLLQNDQIVLAVKNSFMSRGFKRAAFLMNAGAAFGRGESGAPEVIAYLNKVGKQTHVTVSKLSEPELKKIHLWNHNCSVAQAKTEGGVTGYLLVIPGRSAIPELEFEDQTRENGFLGKTQNMVLHFYPDLKHAQAAVRKISALNRRPDWENFSSKILKAPIQELLPVLRIALSQMVFLHAQAEKLKNAYVEGHNWTELERKIGERKLSRMLVLVKLNLAASGILWTALFLGNGANLTNVLAGVIFIVTAGALPHGLANYGKYSLPMNLKTGMTSDKPGEAQAILQRNETYQNDVEQVREFLKSDSEVTRIKSALQAGEMPIPGLDEILTEILRLELTETEPATLDLAARRRAYSILADLKSAIAFKALAEGFKHEKEMELRALAADGLARHFPDVPKLLEILWGNAEVERLAKLLNLESMQSAGFGNFCVENAASLNEVSGNLEYARKILGEEEYREIIDKWRTLGSIKRFGFLHPSHRRFIAFNHQLHFRLPEAKSGGRVLEERQIPPTYVMVQSQKNLSVDTPNRKLGEKYRSFQTGLIKPNFDALNLISEHHGSMTKKTALAIIMLVREMLETYEMLTPAETGKAGRQKFSALEGELEKSWAGLAIADTLPDSLQKKIASYTPFLGLDGIETFHSLINFFHQAGSEAMEGLLRSAGVNTHVILKSSEMQDAVAMRFSKLDDFSLLDGNTIRSRPLRAVVKALNHICNLPEGIAGSFIIFGNHLSFSAPLGVHRVELTADFEAPDEEGGVRLRYFESGNGPGNLLRTEFFVTALKKIGMDVRKSENSGRPCMIEARIDKDHGANSEAQIEYAFIMGLRLLYYTPNLDYAFNAIHEDCRRNMDGMEALDFVKQIAHDIGGIFVSEGFLPFYTFTTDTHDLMFYEFYKRYKASQKTGGDLLKTLDDSLGLLGLPRMPEGCLVGQETIDRYYNQPVRGALARKELRLSADGFPERNPDYRPVSWLGKWIANHEVASEMLSASILDSVNASALDFFSLGTIGRLQAVLAQRELADGGWLLVYGLKDPDSGILLYALSSLVNGEGPERYLTPGELEKLLVQMGLHPSGGFAVSEPQENSLLKQVRDKSFAKEFFERSMKGLPASAADGSLRLGRVTFDRRYYRHLNPQERGNRVLVVPFTTPDDIEAIRNAEAVVATGGGTLSHAGITTRELGVPAVILTNAQWVENGTGIKFFFQHAVGPEETIHGMRINSGILSEAQTVHEGDFVLVHARTGVVAVIGSEFSRDFLRQAYEIITSTAEFQDGKTRLEFFGEWMNALIERVRAAPDFRPVFEDVLDFILLHAFENKKVDKKMRDGIMAGLIKLESGALHQQDKAGREIGAHLRERFDAILNSEVERIETRFYEAKQNILHVYSVKKIEEIVAELFKELNAAGTVAKQLGGADKRLDKISKELIGLSADPHLLALRMTAKNKIMALMHKTYLEKFLPALRCALRRAEQSGLHGHLKNVLFVCAGNTDRSPVAENLFRRILEQHGIHDVEVTSRGISASPGEEISNNARKQLALRGITDLVHFAKLLEPEDVQKADLILVMTQSQLRQVLWNFPNARTKAFRLKDYAKKEAGGDIQDPFGKDETAFSKMAEELATVLRGVLDHLIEDKMVAEKIVPALKKSEKDLAANKHGKNTDGKFDQSILALGDINDSLVDLVGGKMAKLGEISRVVRRHKGHVPEALAVTTIAFDRFLSANGILDAYNVLVGELDSILQAEGTFSSAKLKLFEEKSAEIRSLILNAKLSPGEGLGKAIVEAIETREISKSFMAVRSTEKQEDGKDMAFAGAAETFLHVDKDHVLEKIKETWMSFWLTRGILYRHEQGMRQRDVSPAVMIQKMVNSDVAGVIFTMDPASGKDETIIEASYGQGEVIVSGLVNGDHYRIRKADGVLLSNPVKGTKLLKEVKNPLGIGTMLKPVKMSERRRFVLTQAHIKGLNEIAVVLEKYFGYPLDIEFAIEDGEMAILQVRPVTQRVAARMRFSAASTSQVRQIADSDPGALMPWVRSSAVWLMNRLFSLGGEWQRFSFYSGGGQFRLLLDQWFANRPGTRGFWAEWIYDRLIAFFLENQIAVWFAMAAVRVLGFYFGTSAGQFIPTDQMAWLLFPLLHLVPAIRSGRLEFVPVGNLRLSAWIALGGLLLGVSPLSGTGLILHLTVNWIAPEVKHWGKILSANGRLGLPESGPGFRTLALFLLDDAELLTPGAADALARHLQSIWPAFLVNRIIASEKQLTIWTASNLSVHEWLAPELQRLYRSLGFWNAACLRFFLWKEWFFRQPIFRLMANTGLEKKANSGEEYASKRQIWHFDPRRSL